jgi:hypothetical protein
VLRRLYVTGEYSGTRAGKGDRAGARPLPRPRQDRATRQGNGPGSKWVAFNAIAEHLDYGRRYTTGTNRMQRSFEDTSGKQRAPKLVAAALAWIFPMPQKPRNRGGFCRFGWSPKMRHGSK